MTWAKSWQTPRPSASASAAVVCTLVVPRSYVIAPRTAPISSQAASTASPGGRVDAATSITWSSRST